MRRAALAVLAVALCTPLHTLLAQGWVDIEDRVPSTAAGPVSRVASRVTITVADRVLRGGDEVFVSVRKD